jgi:hypothetical protein
LAFITSDPVETQFELTPDYSRPSWYVYAELVIVQDANNLDIFGYCEGFQQLEGLPSWAPDWSFNTGRYSSQTGTSAKPYTFSSIPNPEMPIAIFSDDLRTMLIRGFVVGRITNSGKVKLSSNPNIADERAAVPKFLLQLFFYFIRLIVWLSMTGLMGYVAKLILAFFRMLMWALPSRRATLAFTVDIFEEMIQHMESDEMRPATSSAKNTSDKNDQDFAGFPSSMDNILELLRAGGRDLMIRTFEWATVLQEPSMFFDEFDTSACDPQEGDWVCLLVGSNNAHILRVENGKWLLIGVADLGATIRWLWKDCVKEFESGTLELFTFEMA